MIECFYNFTIDGQNRGYSYLRYDEFQLYSFTRFSIVNEKIYTNVFRLKIRDFKVIACKHGLLKWVDVSDYPLNHYPSCAYPLLLPQALKESYIYIQVSEDDGSIIGERTLLSKDSDIVELQNGKIQRRFTMNGEIPIRIDWGGAISNLCKNEEESIKDSGIDFFIE